MKKINDLPRSDDDEFWDGEKYPSQRIPISICTTHGKKWMHHVGYKDNHDGTISCKYCGWGCFLPGYLRVHDDKIFDLRTKQPIT
jgi:hypothetical protein